MSPMELLVHATFYGLVTAAACHVPCAFYGVAVKMVRKAFEYKK